MSTAEENERLRARIAQLEAELSRLRKHVARRDDDLIPVKAKCRPYEGQIDARCLIPDAVNSFIDFDEWYRRGWS